MASGTGSPCSAGQYQSMSSSISICNAARVVGRQDDDLPPRSGRCWGASERWIATRASTAARQSSSCGAPRATSALNTRSPRSSTSSRPLLEILRQNLRRAQARRRAAARRWPRTRAPCPRPDARSGCRACRRGSAGRRAGAAHPSAAPCGRRSREPRVAARRGIALQIGDARAGPVRPACPGTPSPRQCARRASLAAAMPAHRDAAHIGIARFSERDLDARLRQQGGSALRPLDDDGPILRGVLEAELCRLVRVRTGDRNRNARSSAAATRRTGAGRRSGSALRHCRRAAPRRSARAPAWSCRHPGRR